jgi:hypothetical protein
MPDDYADIWQQLTPPVGFGRGFMERVIIPQPAAGQGFSVRTVPNDAWEVPLLVNANFTTSAVVANRFASFKMIDPDGTVYWNGATANTVVASSTVQMFGAQNVAQVLSAAGGSRFEIPGIVLPSGWSYGFSISSLDVADQLTQTQVMALRIPSDYASGTMKSDALHMLREIWEHVTRGG